MIGKNGVGKTNILKCIQWLASARVLPEQLWVHFTPFSFLPDKIRVHACLALDPNAYEYVVEVPSVRGSSEGPDNGVEETLTLRGDLTIPPSFSKGWVRRSGFPEGTTRSASIAGPRLLGHCFPCFRAVTPL